MADGIPATTLPAHTSQLVTADELLMISGGAVKRGAASILGAGPFGGSETAVSGATLSLTKLTSLVANPDAGNINVTLPVGTEGITKMISAGTLVGTVTILCPTGVGFTSIVLTNTGNGVTLQYFGGWRIVGKNIG